MEVYQCSFCGKRGEEVRTLIDGPRVFICDECTGRCVEILKQMKGGVTAGPSPQTAEERRKSAELCCAFCGMTYAEVAHLIAGVAHPIADWSICICDECVGLCVEILEEKVAKQKGSE